MSQSHIMSCLRFSEIVSIFEWCQFSTYAACLQRKQDLSLCEPRYDKTREFQTQLLLFHTHFFKKKRDTNFHFFIGTLGQSAKEDLNERTLRAWESGMLAHPLQIRRWHWLCVCMCVWDMQCVCVCACACAMGYQSCFSINISYMYTNSVWCSWLNHSVWLIHAWHAWVTDVKSIQALPSSQNLQTQTWTQIQLIDICFYYLKQ